MKSILLALALILSGSAVVAADIGDCADEYFKKLESSHRRLSIQQKKSLLEDIQAACIPARPEEFQVAYQACLKYSFLKLGRFNKAAAIKIKTTCTDFANNLLLQKNSVAPSGARLCRVKACAEEKALSCDSHFVTFGQIDPQYCISSVAVLICLTSRNGEKSWVHIENGAPQLCRAVLSQFFKL